jgi:hypothetical protein
MPILRSFLVVLALVSSCAGRLPDTPSYWVIYASAAACKHSTDAGSWGECRYTEGAGDRPKLIVFRKPRPWGWMPETAYRRVIYATALTCQRDTEPGTWSECRYTVEDHVSLHVRRLIFRHPQHKLYGLDVPGIRDLLWPGVTAWAANRIDVRAPHAERDVLQHFPVPLMLTLGAL